MLRIVQMEVGGFDLLRSYPRFERVELIQQRGDFPCLWADVNVVETETEEKIVGEIHARFVNQRLCHDTSLGVRVEDVGYSRVGFVTWN